MGWFRKPKKLDTITTGDIADLMKVCMEERAFHLEVLRLMDTEKLTWEQAVMKIYHSRQDPNSFL
jgi:hypothetical protein